MFRWLKCILVGNDCYKKYKNVKFRPVGVVVHSTAPAGRVISRFVQPASGQTDGMEIDGQAVNADQMLAVLGKNRYANDWNRSGREAAVHAFIGTIADGTYAVCQALPYTMPCWGAGSGKNGSYNGCYKGEPAEPLYIQFEMIEDSKASAEHCKALYDVAVEFVANLMLQYPTIAIGNVVSHKEAHGRGCATDHGDPENYWKKAGTGFTMAGFRAAVDARLDALKKAAEPAQPKHPFTDVPDAAWYSDAVQWAYENGIVKGVKPTLFKPDGNCTRSQVVTMLKRLAEYLGNK